MNNNTTRNIILQYFTLLALFIGTGFVAGAVVHTGKFEDINKYIGIGILGIILFVAGSYIQENILNPNTIKEEGKIKFLLYSLILSVGVGMISGGAQHFTDFPIYASFLIPLGLIVSYFAFILKNNFQFTKNLLTIGGIIGVLAIPLFFGLNSVANNIVNSKCKTTFNWLNIRASATGTDTHTNCKSNKALNPDPSTMVNHDMSKLVTDNQSFVYNMIPHHQEAVNTSYIIVNTTKDNELKTFAQNVITNQTKELESMKLWYKLWFSKDYTTNPDYLPMMTDMNSRSDVELDKSYVESMISHHKGAVQMAQSLVILSDAKPELKQLSTSIIQDQNSEIKTMEGWLKTKYISITPKIAPITKAEQESASHNH